MSRCQSALQALDSLCEPAEVRPTWTNRQASERAARGPRHAPPAPAAATLIRRPANAITRLPSWSSCGRCRTTSKAAAACFHLERSAGSPEGPRLREVLIDPSDRLPVAVRSSFDLILVSLL